MSLEDQLSDIEYENEVVGLARKKLKGNEEAIRGYWGRTVLAVGLRGWRPDTEIFVTYEEKGEVKERTWAIWKASGRGISMYEGQRSDTSGMSTIVYSEMSEPD